MSPASYRAAPPRAVVLQPYHGAGSAGRPLSCPAVTASCHDRSAFLVGVDCRHQPFAVAGLLGCGVRGALEGVLKVLLGLAVRVPVALLQGVLAARRRPSRRRRWPLCQVGVAGGRWLRRFRRRLRGSAVASAVHVRTPRSAPPSRVSLKTGLVAVGDRDLLQQRVVGTAAPARTPARRRGSPPSSGTVSRLPYSMSESVPRRLRTNSATSATPLSSLCTCCGPCTVEVTLSSSYRAVVRAGGVRVDRHERAQVGAPVGREGGRQREPLIVLARHLQAQVVRRDRVVVLVGRVVRHLPGVTAAVELRRVGDVVAGEQLALHLEHVLRVPQMGHAASG